MDQQDYNKKTRVSDLREDKIRVASSIPGLKDKIHTHIEEGFDKIYWKIKFNTELDEDSVSKKTMNVTDTRGYLLKTEIKYSNSKIILIPKDSYESNQYYLLNISKKVKSKSGKKLKKEIHILFKLVDNSIVEFKVLKDSDTIPKLRERPKDYEKKYMNPKYIVKHKSTNSKVYSFDTSSVEASKDKLLNMPIKINVILGLLGLIMSIICIFLNFEMGLVISIAILIIGALHIIFQISRKKWRSVLSYNKGVKFFNKERYNVAQIYFQKSLMLDPENELAEFALNKITFYL